MKPSLCLILLFASPLFSEAQDFRAMREQVKQLGELSDPPQVYPAPGYEVEAGLRAIYFEGLEWKGEPTRVFAWLGVPQNDRSSTITVPGIVLVHGGGGTAFKEWVRLWNERGFAAISIAVEGQTDQRSDATKPRSAWTRHAWSGPQRQGIFQDEEEPLENQWMYHALADTILAQLLLASLPEVDSEKVGVMGISWGGVITATVMGLDNRFAFAIPTYGCGNLHQADNHWGQALKSNRVYQNVWDPVLYLPQAHMPTLWLSWTADTHFPMDCLATTYRAASGKRMVALIPKMGHSHPAGWRPLESYVFAEGVIRSQEPWCIQLDLDRDERKVRATFKVTKPIDRALLYTTNDEGEGADRRWSETAVAMKQTNEEVIVEATLPRDTNAWFINLQCGEVVASSDYQKIDDD